MGGFLQYGREPFRMTRCLILGWFCFVECIGAEGLSSAEKDFAARTGATFKEFCFDCHGERKAKGQVNLERMAAAPEFASSFKRWEKVIEMVAQKEMPPEDKPQPTDVQRKKLIASVRQALDGFIEREKGDPGRIAMRQLTSAEYAYTIQDLTGLELGLERNFVSEAVGGEGFSNVGDVQFIQDSTLERYLEAAKIVAARAVVGAGPLRFYRDARKTGQELAAIQRIQEIYRQHGFRTAAGEGGVAYGLEHYPKAFYAAWRFQHRREFGGATLAECARDEGIDVRFVEHVWSTVNDRSLTSPSAEIATAWRKLPNAKDPARAECEKLYRMIRDWQLALAENPGNAEDAPILTEESFKPALQKGFRIRLSWPRGSTNGVFQVSAAPFPSTANAARPAVVWKAGLRFRKGPGAGAAAMRNRQEPKPLLNFVSDELAQHLNFGRAPNGDVIGTNEFITLGAADLAIRFNIPANMTGAELVLETRLDVAHGDDCVTRCVVSHQLNEGATAAEVGTFSAILSNPTGAQTEKLRAGVREFALKFPQISHREPNPADRDPIPEPFDNDYNNAERNDFHAFVKYHRDDAFLTSHILDDATRSELDQAWTDLLTAFDYHNTFLRFVAKKYELGLLDVSKLNAERIELLPPEPKPIVRRLFGDYVNARSALRAAEAGHIRDALQFAQRAWRRPLNLSEKQRLQTFYADVRKQGADHPEAVRTLLARILVAPAFLYRLEPPKLQNSKTNRIPLSDWELASRLSYFLWSSIPDEELSRVAKAGELKEAEGLERQAKRMLRDPKARRFATEFFGQWFGFYRFDDYRGVDTTRFPEFTDNLKADLYKEAISFFDYIVREDRQVQEILFADYSFLNRNLAAHYKIDAPGHATNEVTKVDGVNQFHRGGLLRLGAPLIVTSAPLRTSGVKRGDWILRRVLGRSTPPPPGDAGSIPPDDVLADGKTVRERLEAHRSDASCVNCHSRIDPLGFALEHFDSLGRWREAYRDGQKIDASGTLNDGTEICEVEGLLKYLRDHQKEFERTLSAKLLGYALGRAEQISDGPLLQQMTANLQKDPRFSKLISQIVASPQFRFQRSEIDPPKQSAAVVPRTGQ